MQIGKVPYNTRIRSIQKIISPRRTEVLRGVGTSHDCSVLTTVADGALVVSENPAIYLEEALQTSEWLDAAFYRCVNDIAVSWGSPISLEAVFLLPPALEEADLRIWVQHLEALCVKEWMEYSGGHTETVHSLEKPMAVLTMHGVFEGNVLQSQEKASLTVRRKNFEKRMQARAGQDIVMTRYAGAEVSALLAKHFYEKLAARFSEDFLLKSTAYLKYLSGVPEAAVARKHGVTAMHNISSGGIFGALWEMADGAGLGLHVDVRSIPIRQDTIELCEFFELNPYRLSSCGAILMAADDGQKLTDALLRERIPAAVIGKFTKEKARCLQNASEVRFLDRPPADELWTCLNSYK